MAIAYSASSSSSGSSVTSLTWAHTVSGTQRILVVGVQVNSGSITGVTYNGVAMTRALNIGTSSGNLDIYYLFTPNTGTNNIVASFNTTVSPRAVAASYTGVTGPSLDATSSNGGSGTTLVVNITTVTNNDWVIGVGFNNNGDEPGAGGGTTKRVGLPYISLFDSGGAISPAGSTSLSCTAGSSTSQNMGVIAVKPATSSPTTTTSSSSTSTSTSTSSSTSSSSTSTSSTTTAAPPPDVQQTGIPIVFTRN